MPYLNINIFNKHKSSDKKKQMIKTKVRTK